MEKFIITADWHIKIRPDVNFDWQLRRYSTLIETIVAACKQQGASLVLAGDILDKSRPTLQELSLFMHLIRRLDFNKVTTYLISGNHESLGRGESVYEYLSGYLDWLPNTHFLCQPAEFQIGDFVLDFVGHPHIGSLISDPADDGERRILISHFRATINQFVVEELDVEKALAPYEVCFAGDIHAPLEFHDDKLIYVNAPVNSVFEAQADCSYLLLSIDGSTWEWERVQLDLPNLLAVTCNAEDFKEPDDEKHFYQIKVQGTPDELRMVTTDKENIKLIKEPIVDHEFVDVVEESYAGEVSTEKALVQYMEEMGLTTEKISQMMEVFQQDEE